MDDTPITIAEPQGREKIIPKRSLKFVFLHEEIRDRAGIMSLSAVLKQAGHRVDVFIEELSENLIADVLGSEPDIVCLSTMTPGIEFGLNAARAIKKERNVPIMMGSPHPTFYPQVLEEDCIDIICLGEGEDAIVEFANRYANDLDYRQIDSLHVKINGEIFKNAPGKFKDPDSMPLPDRTLYYDKFPGLRDAATKKFFLVRGCPYECTYCFNHKQKQMTKGMGKYVRYGSIERAVEEIRQVKDAYGAKWIQINSDTLNVDRNWFLAFLDLYKKEIGLPFLCNVVIHRVDEEMVAKMKEAGCDRVDYGIEHGDEHLRRTVLKRYMSDEQIITGGQLFNKYGIRTQTANLIGIPHETVETVMKTVRLNQKVRPEVARIFPLLPFEGTEIRAYAEEHGFFEADWQKARGEGYKIVADKTAYGLDFPLKVADRPRMTNLVFFFTWMVRYPALEWIFLQLSKLPPNRFFKFLYVLPISMIEIRFASNNKARMKFIGQLLGTLFRG